MKEDSSGMWSSDDISPHAKMGRRKAWNKVVQILMICCLLLGLCSCSKTDGGTLDNSTAGQDNSSEMESDAGYYTYNDFAETEDKVREEELENYLIENPHLNEVVENIHNSYYFNLDGYTLEAGDDFDETLIGQLDINYCIPTYPFPYIRDDDGDGNTFARLSKEVSQKPFASLLPVEIYYMISVVDETEESIGYAYAHMAEDKVILDFFWDGTTINTFTLKLSKELMQALVESQLDLENMETRYAEFGGYGGAVFYDGKTALFSPVANFFTSVGGLDVGHVYPLTMAIDTFEKSFADD